MIPDSKNALAELDAKDIALRGSVIWLDDIDRLIGADGITDGSLRRLAAAGTLSSPLSGPKHMTGSGLGRAASSRVGCPWAFSNGLSSPGT